MVRLDRLTTKGGDKGETSLGDGSRVRKDSTRIRAMGAVDETNAAIGLLRLSTSGEIDAILERVQNELFDVGADLCFPQPQDGGLRISASQIGRLEAEIKNLTDALPPLKSFVFPGGANGSAHAHLARTIARRAECEVVHLVAQEPVNEAVIVYLNRLSDLLFAVGRTIACADPLWKPGATQK